MQIRVFGPLEVVDGERIVDLCRPRQRAVLAALLGNANRVVSLDRFADLLWPDGAADRGLGSLPVYVSNVRRLLERERPAGPSLNRSDGHDVSPAGAIAQAIGRELLPADEPRRPPWAKGWGTYFPVCSREAYL